MNELSKQKTWVAVQELMREYPDDPNKIIARCEREAEDRERRAKALQGEAIAFRQMIDAVGSLSGVRVAPTPQPAAVAPTGGRTFSTPEKPAGTEAVRRILREGGIWTIKGLLEELKHRDWDSKTAQNPLKATEAAVSRLVTVKKEVERVGRGEYRYIGPPTSQAAPDSQPSFPATENSSPGASTVLDLRGLRERQS